MWQSKEQKLVAFFKNVVLPELVGKHFSNLTVRDNEPTRKAKISQKPEKSLSTQSTTSGLTNLTSSTKKRPIKKTAHLDANETDENIANYYICNGDAKGVRIVACDLEDCPHKPFEWFHFTCWEMVLR